MPPINGFQVLARLDQFADHLPFARRKMRGVKRHPHRLEFRDFFHQIRRDDKILSDRLSFGVCLSGCAFLRLDGENSQKYRNHKQQSGTHHAIRAATTAEAKKRRERHAPDSSRAIRKARAGILANHGEVLVAQALLPVRVLRSHWCRLVRAAYKTVQARVPVLLQFIRNREASIHKASRVAPRIK